MDRMMQAVMQDRTLMPTHRRPRMMTTFRSGAAPFLNASLACMVVPSYKPWQPCG